MNDEDRYRKIIAYSKIFWTHVDKSNTDGCWPWLLSVNQDGYGNLAFTKAHRAAWMLTHGKITSKECVCHHCDNPPCCNPSHLFVGSQLMNIEDRDSKGRQCKGEERSVSFKNALRELKKKDPEAYKRNYGERQSGTGNPQAKLTEKDVIFIRNAVGTEKELSSMFDVKESTIGKIRRRETWKHVT